MLNLDGSRGEGGGQILRTALGLALVTGRAVRIDRARARRPRPGLGRQHLAAVRAAAEVGEARVEGDSLGSTRLVFRPGRVRAGTFRFAVGTAGSTTLVFQTVLPALLQADGPSHLVLEGGTHNPWAPPFDFLERAFLPLLARQGARVAVRLERHGFYPAGGGRWTADIAPPGTLRPIDLPDRGALHAVSARALVARLPRSIAERELRVVGRELEIPPARLEAVEVRDAAGPGNCVLIECAAERLTEVFTAFGARGVRAETVAERAAGEARRYLAADVACGPHLADQLLVPIALAGRGSFTTLRPTPHLSTNADVVRAFLDVPIGIEETGPDRARVQVGVNAGPLPGP